MASKLLMTRSNINMLSLPAVQLSPVARRSLSTLSRRPSHYFQPLRHTSLPNPAFQRSFRRAYADAPIAPPQSPKPKRRFRVFRWMYRLTLLSLLGGAGALGYNVYSLRNPADQEQPDPSKKTLVILGARTSRLMQATML